MTRTRFSSETIDYWSEVNAFYVRVRPASLDRLFVRSVYCIPLTADRPLYRIVKKRILILCHYNARKLNHQEGNMIDTR